MAGKESLGIDMIQCGRIDFYVPLKFETKYNYVKLCQKINNAINNSIEKHEKYIHQDTQEMCEDLNKKFLAEPDGKMSLFQKSKKLVKSMIPKNKRRISRENMNNCIELGFTEKGLSISLPLEELRAYQDRCDEIAHEFEQVQKLYGLGYAGSQNRYVLLPLHVQLTNDEFVWFNVILYIFENKAGILKLELPLVNVSPQPLFDYEYDEFIKRIENPWLMDMHIKDFTINSIRDMYISTFLCKYGINVVAQEGTLKNVILSKFNGMPKQMNNITLEVQEDLYRIIAAPVSVIDSTSYKQTAREYINKYSWGKHNMKYICSTTGGCLSFVDTALVNYLQTEYKSRWEVEEFTELEIEKINRSIIRDLCINVEFALVILLLKQMNTKYFYQMKLQKPQDMHDVHRAYNFNQIYIAELQEECYGTVSEQVAEFEQIMPYYIKEDITISKMEAMDRILADEEMQRNTLLQTFLSLGGVLMALIFGLPAIHETVSIIRRLCSFITYDIPVLTIDNISVCMWLILIIVLLIVTIDKWKPKKGKSFFVKQIKM